MASPMAEADDVRVRVAGKINLALRSGPRRDDGYHGLSTVFQAVSLYDEVIARWAEPGQISVTVTGDQADLVPTDETNLAVRAARLLRDLVATSEVGVALEIHKTIPVTGGMAGARRTPRPHCWRVRCCGTWTSLRSRCVSSAVGWARTSRSAWPVGRRWALIAAISWFRC